MTGTVALLALQLVTTPASPPTEAAEASRPPLIQQPVAPDRWLAEDKLRHFFLSFAATGIGYGAARTALERDTARPAAVGAALASGLWKEWRDRRAGGPFSAKDLVWDALGVALGALLVSEIR